MLTKWSRLLLCIAALALLTTPALAMNKGDLIAAQADAADISKAQSASALEGFIDATSASVKKGDSVTLVGFGTFSSSKRASHKGRNPQTGKEIKVGKKLKAKDVVGQEPFVTSTMIYAANPALPQLFIEFAIPPNSASSAVFEFQIPEKVVMEKEDDFYRGQPAGSGTVTLELHLELPARCKKSKKPHFVNIELPYNQIVGDGTDRLGTSMGRVAVAASSAQPGLQQRYLADGNQSLFAEALGLDHTDLDAALAPQPTSQDCGKKSCGPSDTPPPTPPVKVLAKNKADIVAAIAKSAKLDPKKSGIVVDLLTNPGSLGKLKKHQNVSLVGFGSFTVRKRGKRTGSNPQTGKPIVISARTVAKFKPGKTFEDSL